MNILAIDTASPYCSVAVMKDTLPLTHKTLSAGHTHSESLLPLIDSLLKEAKLKISDIELFAVSSNPGSFTGVRIGVAAIKGLAFDSGKPCVGVSTLEALAENLSSLNGFICPLMDARRNQFYTALFRVENNKIKRLTEDSMLSYESVNEMISEKNGDVYLCGDGYALGKKLLNAQNIKDTPDELIIENAVSVGKVALRQYLSGNCADFTDLTLKPGYLRPSQAEQNSGKII